MIHETKSKKLYQFKSIHLNCLSVGMIDLIID